MIGNAASQLLEAESENESPEDREYVAARRFIGLARNTARYGARMPAIPNRRAASLRALHYALQRGRNRRLRIARLRAARRRLAMRRYGRSIYGGPVYLDDGFAPDSGDDGDAAMDTGGLAAGVGNDGVAHAGPGDASHTPATGSAPSAPGSTNGAGEHEAYGFDYSSPIGGVRSGRWVRRGRKIILYGV
jgi:hypothetical protein